MEETETSNIQVKVTEFDEDNNDSKFLRKLTDLVVKINDFKKQ